MPRGRDDLDDHAECTVPDLREPEAPTGNWSVETRGIRSRLVLDQRSLAAGESLQIWLDLRNEARGPVPVALSRRLVSGLRICGPGDKVFRPRFGLADREPPPDEAQPWRLRIDPRLVHPYHFRGTWNSAVDLRPDEEILALATVLDLAQHPLAPGEYRVQGPHLETRLQEELEQCLGADEEVVIPPPAPEVAFEVRP